MTVGATNAAPPSVPDSPVGIQAPLSSPTVTPASSEGKRLGLGLAQGKVVNNTPWIHQRRSTSPDGEARSTSSEPSSPGAREEGAVGGERRDVGTNARGRAGGRDRGGRRRPPRRFVGGYFRGPNGFRGGFRGGRRGFPMGRRQPIVRDDERPEEEVTEGEGEMKIFPGGRKGKRGGGRGSGRYYNSYPAPFLYPFPGAADFQKMVYGRGGKSRSLGSEDEDNLKMAPMVAFCPVHYPMLSIMPYGGGRFPRGGRSFRGRRRSERGRFDAGRDGTGVRVEEGAESSEVEHVEEPKPVEEEKKEAPQAVEGGSVAPFRPRRRRAKKDKPTTGGDEKKGSSAAGAVPGLQPQDLDVFKKFTENFTANIAIGKELLKKLEKVTAS